MAKPNNTLNQAPSQSSTADSIGSGQTEKANLYSYTREALEEYCKQIGQPAFRGRQLFKWIYGKGARTFAEMTDLPVRLREYLDEHATLTPLKLDLVQYASDRTIKCLFALKTGKRLESVLIPDFEEDGTVKRLTVCVSSQVGCAMGCSFCATGLMGFQQNLTAGEIYDQVWQLNQMGIEQFDHPVTNIVFMGMGEPLQNYKAVLTSISFMTDPEGMGLAPRRITVSTVGLARRIRQLADDNTRFNLAVSLHAPTDDKRSDIMPVNRNERTDLDALMDALQYYTRQTGRRVTFEYCMFSHYNDTIEDARHLAGLANKLNSKVNLIMYNPVPELPFERTSEKRLNRFIKELVNNKVLVTVRRSRGDDIAAACGQLLVNEA